MMAKKILPSSGGLANSAWRYVPSFATDLRARFSLYQKTTPSPARIPVVLTGIQP